jgi:hypothetical protein
VHIAHQFVGVNFVSGVPSRKSGAVDQSIHAAGPLTDLLISYRFKLVGVNEGIALAQAAFAIQVFGNGLSARGR